MWKSPAFERNKEPIASVLRELIVVPSLDILEVASGPGQHICYFATKFPKCSFQPTEQNEGSLQSIARWTTHLKLENVCPPTLLDVNSSSWQNDAFDIVIAINFLHMVPEQTVTAFLQGAGQTLRSGGQLIVYDCFTFDGLHVSDSNRIFDQHLRATTDGCVHGFEPISQLANRWNLSRPEVVKLPANNQAVIWTRDERIGQ